MFLNSLDAFFLEHRGTNSLCLSWIRSVCCDAQKSPNMHICICLVSDVRRKTSVWRWRERETQSYTSNKSTLRCFVWSSFKICNLIRRMKADQITTAFCILYVTLPSTTGNHSTFSKSKPSGHGRGAPYIKPETEWHKHRNISKTSVDNSSSYGSPFVPLNKKIIIATFLYLYLTILTTFLFFWSIWGKKIIVIIYYQAMTQNTLATA